MARRPTQRQRIEQLAAQWGPVIEAAFIEAVHDLRRNVRLSEVIRALEANNLEAAIDAMHLDPAAFRQMDLAVTQTYVAGGVATAASLPILQDAAGNRAVVRFDMRNPRAEIWLQENGGAKIADDVVIDQRVMVRKALQEGVERGDNPRTIALDIAGRVNRQTGRREGGLIGLSDLQKGYVDRARVQLTSNDKEMFMRYFRRERRNKRLDAQLKHYINNGQTPPRSLIDRALRDYKNSLLQLRGETIARLEAKASLHAAEHETYQQAIDAGQIKRQNVNRKWLHAGNPNPRDQHIMPASAGGLNGQVVGFDEPFKAPDGTLLMYPCDPRADIKHTANCHCQTEYRIDFAAELLGEE